MGARSFATTRCALLARSFAVVALALACERTPELQPALVGGDLSALDPEVIALLAAQVERVRREPSQARAHGSLGLMYEANDLWEAAAQSYANAAEIDPDEALWRYHRSVVLREIGQAAEADRLLRESAAELTEHPGVQHRLGMSFLDANDLAHARAALTRALARAPDDPVCLVGLASVEAAEEKWAAARDLCLRAVRKDPGFRQAHFVLGIALRGLGQHKEAADALALGLDAKRRYLDDPLSPELKSYQVSYVSQSQEAVRLGEARRFDEALALWERILKKRPDDVTVLSNYGGDLIESGRPDRAIPVLERAVALDEDEFGPHINLTHAYQRTGDLAKAMLHADRSVALAPELAAAHLARARVLVARQDYAAAHQELVETVRLDARDYVAHVALSETCARLGRFEDARRWCRKAVELNPNYLPGRVNLANYDMRAGDVAAARAQVKDLVKLAPNEPRVRALAEQLGVAIPAGAPR